MPLDDGESVIWSRRANHTVGWRAVGGKLYLTDRRLLFRPHVLERSLFFGKEWSAPRTEVAGFDVQPRGGGNPFDGSLRSRLRVALRHTARTAQEPGEAVFTVGDLRVDMARRQVFVTDQEVHLTPIEYKLLTTLVRYAGRVVTHRQLLQEGWGPGHTEASHYLRVYMGQLRHKLEADPARPRYLVTEPGVGYRLKTD